nr:polysaccharide pyruvyl transferase family protein [Pediococcus pentosaceus]
MDVPTNGNIGDQAIVYATYLFLNELKPNYSILEVPYTDLNASLNTLRRNLAADTLVILNGGGNLGDIYPSEEFNRWTTFRMLKQNKKILFPQSVSFKTNKEGLKMLKKSINSYEKSHKLNVFLRERKSFNFFKENYKNVDVNLVPDIVFSLENKIQVNDTEKSLGVLTLLRDDIEKSDYDLSNLFKAVTQKNKKLTKSDTYIPNIKINEKSREKLVLSKIEEISRYELVITDRLHGMILSYLAHTPVIVLENNNWKIKSTYQTWLKDASFVKLINSNPTYLEAKKILEILENVDTSYINVSDNFEVLKTMIRDDKDE